MEGRVSRESTRTPSTAREEPLWEPSARHRSGSSRPRAARALLNHLPASSARRLHARPRDGDGPEEILERDRSALATRLRAAAALRRTETVEPQVWGTGRIFPGSIVVKSRGGTIVTATRHGQGGTIWTDGSRLDNKRVGQPSSGGRRAGGPNAVSTSAATRMFSMRRSSPSIRISASLIADRRVATATPPRQLHRGYQVGTNRRSGPRPGPCHRGDGGL